MFNPNLGTECLNLHNFLVVTKIRLWLPSLRTKHVSTSIISKKYTTFYFCPRYVTAKPTEQLFPRRHCCLLPFKHKHEQPCRLWCHKGVCREVAVETKRRAALGTLTGDTCAVVTCLAHVWVYEHTSGISCGLHRPQKEMATPVSNAQTQKPILRGMWAENRLFESTSQQSGF